MLSQQEPIWGTAIFRGIQFSQCHQCQSYKRLALSQILRNMKGFELGPNYLQDNKDCWKIQSYSWAVVVEPRCIGIEKNSARFQTEFHFEKDSVAEAKTSNLNLTGSYWINGSVLGAIEHYSSYADGWNHGSMYRHGPAAITYVGRWVFFGQESSFSYQLSNTISFGLGTLCEGPQTLMKWKSESVIARGMDRLTDSPG